MAFPVQLGKPEPSKSRDSFEAPGGIVFPGDLYTLRVPLLVQGAEEGQLTAEFFLADAKGLADVLGFIRSGPRVRWDI